VLIGPPKALGFPKPESSVNTSSTFGAPSGAAIGATEFQSGCEPSSVLFATPRKGARRIGRLVRSIDGSLIYGHLVLAWLMQFHPSDARERSIAAAHQRHQSTTGTSVRAPWASPLLISKRRYRRRLRFSLTSPRRIARVQPGLTEPSDTTISSAGTAARVTRREPRSGLVPEALALPGAPLWHRPLE
jgi:hypothetical protein